MFFEGYFVLSFFVVSGCFPLFFSGFWFLLCLAWLFLAFSHSSCGVLFVFVCCFWCVCCRGCVWVGGVGLVDAVGLVVVGGAAVVWVVGGVGGWGGGGWVPPGWGVALWAE